ncbi:MAG TPA: cysteine synthase A [Syntrophomonas sp.]|jgi:cysteine synthase A|nr:cysteine synthase A [Syntrophomonas sp.]
MKVANNILELIGETPLLKLNRITGKEDAEVYVKLESFNPGGSIKDRPGLYMIEKAEQTGKIGPGSMILEATSGNTGIGLAMAAAIKGYPIVIVMPENMSEERKKLLRFYGAQLVLTPADKGMAGAVETAVQMVESDARYYLIKQFENPYNAESHEVSTAQEILKQTEGRLDALVCGVGSGGTLTGIARVLKEKIPGVQIVAVEPANSAILSGKSAGSHKIQGIGAGFIPPVLNINLIDRIMDIEDNAALDTCRELARKEALLVGISSGAAIFAALQLAQELGRDKRILTIAADGAEKYVSTELFD